MAAAAATPVVTHTARQLWDMEPAARHAYLQHLSPEERKKANAALAKLREADNRAYMANTIRKEQVCIVASGGGLSQAWTAGATLPFTIPTSNNGYAEGIFIREVLSVTLGAGTSAVYALTAGGVLNTIDNILVTYNGTQHKIHPYILKTYNMLQGELQPPIPYSVLAGQSITGTQNYLTGTYPVAVGANTWTIEYYMPFNLLAPQSDCRGMLPIMGAETQAQVQITCAPALFGVDPILNSVYAVSGSGHTATATGTVAVYAIYRDGTSYTQNHLFPLELEGIPTTQFQLDQPLTGISAGQVYRQKFTVNDKIYYALLTVVDGQQSNAYSTNANIAVLEADKDASGSNVFWKVGTGSNLSVNEYFTQIRLQLTQDLDQGIVPIIAAPPFNTDNPTNLTGHNYLNTGPKGWPDYHYGIQLTAIGAVAGITPRVECHLIWLNSRGLVGSA